MAASNSGTGTGVADKNTSMGAVAEFAADKNVPMGKFSANASMIATENEKESEEPIKDPAQDASTK